MKFKQSIRAAIVLVLTAVLASCSRGNPAASKATVDALYTEAAGTILAQVADIQTQTAAAIPTKPLLSPTALDTFTPLPTFPIGVTPFGTPFALGTPLALTPHPTAISTGGFAVGCNNAIFQAETVPDKTVFKVAKKFSKAWEFLNAGTCRWDEGYGFFLKSGERLSGLDVIIPGTCPAMPAGTPASLCTTSSSKQVTLPGHTQTFVVHMEAPLQKGEYIGYWQMKDDTGAWFGSLVSVDIIVSGR